MFLLVNATALAETAHAWNWAKCNMMMPRIWRSQCVWASPRLWHFPPELPFCNISSVERYCVQPPSVGVYNQLDHHQMFNIVKWCPQSVATFWKSSCGFFTVGGPGPNSIRPRLRCKSAKDLVVQEPFAWSLLRAEETTWNHHRTTKKCTEEINRPCTTWKKCPISFSPTCSFDIAASLQDS